MAAARLAGEPTPVTEPAVAEPAPTESEPVEEASEVEVAEQMVEAKHELDETCEEIGKTQEVIADTQDQLDAQKQILANPAQVTPAEVVVATEAFRANLRLLGASESYVRSMAFVNTESIVANPAQLLSIVHVDMEGFVDTAKRVLAKLWEKIKQIVKWIKDLIMKGFNGIKAKLTKGKEVVKKKLDAKKGQPLSISGWFKKMVSKIKGNG